MNKDYLIGRLFRKMNDNDIANNHFEIAAKDGHVKSMVELADFYYNKHNEISSSMEECKRNVNNRIASRWYRRAASLGHIEACYKLSNTCLRREELTTRIYKECLKWFECGAIRGHAESQFEMGCINLSGDYRTTIDLEKAINWFTMASEKSHKKSQDHLIKLYLYSEKFANAQLAFKWALALSKFYDVNDVENNVTYMLEAEILAWMYYHGHGTDQDYKKAKKWCETILTVLHHKDIGFMLGKIYYYGLGVEKDIQKAKELFKKSAKDKCKDSARYLVKIENKI